MLEMFISERQMNIRELAVFTIFLNFLDTEHEVLKCQQSSTFVTVWSCSVLIR